MRADPEYTTYYAAIDADDAWQAELDRLGICRYSPAAKGDAESELRRLYERKVGADRTRSAEIDAVRSV